MKKILKIVFPIIIAFIAIQASVILTFHQESNNNPLPSFYKKGVYHVHSIYSDGGGDINEITQAASRDKLDFVILTDHGRPNRQSSQSTQWLHGVLLIGASELPLYSGHMTAAGYNLPAYMFPPEPQEAINEVIKDQGICFIAHPFDLKIPWSDWDIENFTGIELLNSYYSSKMTSLIKTIILPFQYLFGPSYALTSIIQYPEKEIKQWDAFLTHGKYSGIYALDAHARIPITNNFQLNIPSYQSMFKIFTVYVKADHALDSNASSAASAVIASIKSGNFFDAIESIASANGFDNYYLQSDRKRIDMGGNSEQPGGTLVFILPFSFPTDIFIKKDGKIFKHIIQNTQKELFIPIGEPGVYRAEIFVPQNRFHNLPWLVTNPFFIGIKEKKRGAETFTLQNILLNKDNYFQIEKNEHTQAGQSYEWTNDHQVRVNFNFKLQKEPSGDVNFWAALSHREPKDFSHFKGIIFKVKGSRRMRLLLQFRTLANQTENAYQHSFLVDKEWTAITIPFHKFHQLYGNNNQLPELTQITSFFILIDNSNAFPGAKGSITLTEFGLY